MKGTPLIQTTQNVGAGAGAEFVPPPVSGGGPSSPPDSGGPARADETSAPMSASVSRAFFNSDSPLFVVTGYGGYAARIPHDIPIDPEVYVLWLTLFQQGRLTEAARLCRERAETAPTLAALVCHMKDLAIVRRAAGEYEAALDIHISLNPFAANFTGSFRARIDQGFARSQETLRRYDRAFELYTSARVYAECDPYQAAQVDCNTGRCYTAARNPSASHPYFDRAAAVATRLADFHLLGEIAESRALAYEAEGRFEEAEESAWESIQLLTPTGDKTATAESFETWQRVRALAVMARIEEGEG